MVQIKQSAPCILGLTGSIAMGKTTIGSIFQKYGVPVFNADEVVLDLYQDQKIQEILKREFPFLSTKKKITKQDVGQYIVKYPEKLPLLEKILYPLLAKKRQDFVLEQKKNKKTLIVFDIPLLYEKKLTHLVDKILVVDTPKDVQKQRALARPNMNEEKFSFLLAKQIDNKEKCKYADYIIDTSQSFQECEKQVRQLIARLKEEEYA